MGCPKSNSYERIFSIILGAALIPVSWIAPQLERPSLAVTFPPTETVRAPQRTAGGGTRSGTPAETSTCVSGAPLTVLSPLDNVVTTVSDHPTLFWYIPQTQAKSAEFVVFDQQRTIVYQTTLALKNTPGIVRLSLPKTVNLETNKNYQWKLVLRCNPESWWDDVMVGGFLKRTMLTSEQKRNLAAAKQPLEQAEVYAQAKVWQETLSILAQLRADRPNDPTIRNAWTELLDSVRLSFLENAPLTECCKVERTVPSNP